MGAFWQVVRLSATGHPASTTIQPVGAVNPPFGCTCPAFVLGTTAAFFLCYTLLGQRYI